MYVRNAVERNGRRLIKKSTGDETVAKQCDYVKSDMTPCVIRDGTLCYGYGPSKRPECVGCGRGPEATGVPKPADWEARVAAYDRKVERRR